MGSDQQFCLRWHNYQSSLLASLPQLLDCDDLTDVTLSAGGRSLRAHRVVLSACSQYFKELFKVLQPMQHPVIVLPATNFTDLFALITFMYSGEVNIYQEQLQGLLTMADALQIKGLAGVKETANNDTSSKDMSNPPAKRPKLSMQTSSQPITQTQTASENSKTEIESLQKEMSELSGNSVRGSKLADFELYRTGHRVTGGARKAVIDPEPQQGTVIKNESAQFRSMGENLELYARSGHSTTLSETDDVPSHNPSLMGSPVTIKMEPCTSSEAPSPSRKPMGGTAAALEGVQATGLENELIQDEHSPSSDDSGGDNPGIQLGQGRHLSNLKLASSPSQYSKMLATCTSPSNNSKLYATCFVCGKQLSNQYNLRVHMETHQNVNYACSVCSHVSRSRDALRKHVSYRHPGEGRERPGVGGHSREGRVPIGNTNGVQTARKTKLASSVENIKCPP